VVNGKTAHIPSLLPASAFRPDYVQTSFFDGKDAAAAAVERQAQRADSGEAAGFIPLKTSRIEQIDKSAVHWKKAHFDVSFCRSRVALKRVKRLKRAVWASGHLHGVADHGHRPPVCWFVTLTYARANEWRPNHISEATAAYRRWCKRKGVPCRYTWVSEIQPKRAERTGENVVHYHLLAWLPIGVKMPFWDKSTTSSGRHVVPFWDHGMSNTEKAKSGVGYLMKYLSKLGELTIFPDGLRLYGVGGLDTQARAVRAWYNLPEWAKNTYGVGDLQRVGAALVERSTGEILQPLYSAQFIPGGIRLTPLREVPVRDPDQAGAYSTFPRTV